MLQRLIRIEEYLGLPPIKTPNHEDVYEHQIKVITEDFNQARSDRIKQYERAEQLKAQMERLQRDYNTLGRKCSALENTNRSLNTGKDLCQNIVRDTSAMITRGLKMMDVRKRLFN